MFCQRSQETRINASHSTITKFTAFTFYKIYEAGPQAHPVSLIVLRSRNDLGGVFETSSIRV